MNGQRRSGIWTEWNSSLRKKMNNAVFRTTVEPRNNSGESNFRKKKAEI